MITFRRGDRVWAPWSAKTRGTVIYTEPSITGNTLVFVRFDRPCGPGPDSQGFFASQDLRRVEFYEIGGATDDDHRVMAERYRQLLVRLRQAEGERDEAIEKLRRAVRVLTGVDDE